MVHIRICESYTQNYDILRLKLHSYVWVKSKHIFMAIHIIIELFFYYTASFS